MSSYKNQTKLRIRRTLGADITGALTLLLKYYKPDGTYGEWIATSEDDLTGIIYYDVTIGNEIDMSGKWKIWAHVVFADNRTAPGDVTSLDVKIEGL